MMPDTKLADLAERYWQFECGESLLTAVLAGEKNEATTFFRESEADYVRRDATATDLLAELAQISVDGLTDQDRDTHRLMTHELEAARALYAVRSHQRPSLLPVGPDFNTIYLANSTTLSTAEDAKLYVQRLASLPHYFDELRTNMLAGHAHGIRYPRVVLEGAAKNVLALQETDVEATAWYGPFKRTTNGGDAMKEAAARALSVIHDAVLPALARYAEMMTGTLMADPRETIAAIDGPQGREFYSAWAKHFTTTGDTPDAIHALGLSEVARLDGELAKVAAEAGYVGDLPGYRAHLAGNPDFVSPNPEALRERLQVVCKRIDRLLPSFFARLPRISYGVETIPAAMAGKLPPAYAQPAPADNSSAGIFWLTCLTERCPSYMHVPLALHEGWPGHLMHIALMQENSDLPAFRRNGSLKYIVYVEGWALYCETLGIDMGLYTTPDQHFGRIEFELWRAIRLVLDTGIHWLGWSRDQAINYMLARLSLSRETVEQEVDRYIALPGQALAYQIGSLKIRELRARAERTLGDRFSLRAFHEAVMTSGPVSMPLLEEVVDRWIAREVDAVRLAA